jgi:hypothetical protein
MADDGVDDRQLSPGRFSFRELAQSRHDFLISDRLLLTPEQMVKYSDHWVAAYNGEVKVFDESYDRLMGRLGAIGLPLGSVAIRFIEKDGMAAP